MAGPSGILALAMKPKGGALPKPEGEGAAPSMDPKAAALKSMYANMKAGDFEAAAMDFEDAYGMCGEHDESEEESPLSGLGGGGEEDSDY